MNLILTSLKIFTSIVRLIKHFNGDRRFNFVPIKCVIIYIMLYSHTVYATMRDFQVYS